MVEVITNAIRMMRLCHDICPFRVGQRVRVKPTAPYGEEWRGVYIITGIRWDYQRGTGNGINISIASDDEIVRRNGDTDGWSPHDLLPE